MTQATLDTITLSDGYRAAVRWWRVPKPRGAVLYLHGIQSHGGWYESSGERLAEAGFTVLMPDRRGSGMNREQRGHVASATRAVDDVKDALDTLLRETGFRAAHVVGVSWGGKPAVVLGELCPRQAASITLVAPGLFSKVDISTGEKFRVAMALVNARERQFEIPLNDPRLFTVNSARIRFVEGDVLKLTQVSASFLLATRRLDRAARRFEDSAYRGPVHLFLAGKDRIIDNERTRQWLRGLASPDRQITEYPEAYHTLEFEEDTTEYFDDLVGWISDRCKPGAAETSSLAPVAVDP